MKLERWRYIVVSGLILSYTCHTFIIPIVGLYHIIVSECTRSLL